MSTNSHRRLSKAPAFFIKHYYFTWTLLFLATAAPVFVFFILNGKTLVMAGDGFKQHYKALLYFSRWVRSVLRNIFIDHSLSIPTFSFSFGLGSDLFTTLQYYVIGDPFALLSFLVPMRYMLYYYEFMIILRLYLAGLAFSAFARYQHKAPVASLAGSITYSFCSWVMYASVKHPYFSNPMICLPLLLLGIEKYQKEKKTVLFIFMVALSAVSNFYFFYMLVLLTIAYVLLKSFIPFKKNKLKKQILTILKIGGYSLVGVLLSAVLFLPVILLFFGDERSKTGYIPNLLYAVSYYSKLPSSLITSTSPGNWTYAGISAVSILAVFLLIIKSGEKRLRMKAAYLTALIGLALPYVGYAFNGFSYSANRWSWAFCFLTAYILSDLWPDLFHLTKKEVFYLLGCLALYFVVCFLSAFRQLSVNFYISFGLAALTLLLLVLCRRTDTHKTAALTIKNFRIRVPRHVSSVLMIIFVLTGIIENAYFVFAPGQGNYIAQFCDVSTFHQNFNFSEASAVQTATDTEEFYRYSGFSKENIIQNTSLFTGLHNTQIYWSLTNGNVTRLYNKTLTSIKHISNIVGFDSRTFLEELASVRYYVTRKQDIDKVPYGYKLVSKSDNSLSNGVASGFLIYENQYALPLGYTYSSAISEETADNMSPLQRQEAMLSSVILDSHDSVLTFSGAPESAIQSLDWSLQTSSDKISYQNNSFVVKKPGESVVFNFEGMSDSETYLAFDNLQFKGTSTHSIYGEPSSFNLQVSISCDNTTESPFYKDVFYETSHYHWYNGRKDYLINMGYSEKARNCITVTFPKRGIYRFDSLNIYCQPTKNYAKKTEELKQDVLENINFHENSVYATNHVTGTISLKQNKILCLSIPYSDGWTAYVDGQKTDIIKANYAYMALNLQKGNHKIKLVYHTPGLKAGAIISVFSLTGVIITAVIRKKRHESTENMHV